MIFSKGISLDGRSSSKEGSDEAKQEEKKGKKRCTHRSCGALFLNTAEESTPKSVFPAI
ncbi:MAG: hypothetical protein QRY74_05325 [Chlamydia sp.]